MKGIHHWVWFWGDTNGCLQTQRNFQGNNNNFIGNKGAQQNGAKNNNNSSNETNQQKSGAAGKLNVLSRHEADSTKDVITGTFSINSIPVKFCLILVQLFLSF